MPSEVLTLSTAEEKGRVAITVGDTGTGLPPDRLENIFEDLKTTKRRVFGLAICRKIVAQLERTISVVSAVGRGTAFRLDLAQLEGQPETPAASATAS